MLLTYVLNKQFWPNAESKCDPAVAAGNKQQLHNTIIVQRCIAREHPPVVFFRG